ncbi:MAG: hypothetical protein Q8K50_01810 [Hydrogenophaga sp.]|nr:hypothetical protein [Hydrogenophaga sp.]
MNVLWPLLLPLLRPLLIKLGALLGVLVLVWGGLYALQQSLLPDWQQAQGQQQVAQALLAEAQADQIDLDTHRRTYEQLKASGLLGGEPRAVWVEDLLRTSASLGLQAQVSFTLGSPQAVELPQAQAIGARVTRHTLDYTMTGVHELEVLQLTDQYMQAHQGVARLMGCALEQPTPEGLGARCRVNFLHIEPPATPSHNAGN